MPTCPADSLTVSLHVTPAAERNGKTLRVEKHPFIEAVRVAHWGQVSYPRFVLREGRATQECDPSARKVRGQEGPIVNNVGHLLLFLSFLPPALGPKR